MTSERTAIVDWLAGTPCHDHRNRAHQVAAWRGVQRGRAGQHRLAGAFHGDVSRPRAAIPEILGADHLGTSSSMRARASALTRCQRWRSGLTCWPTSRSTRGGRYWPRTSQRTMAFKIVLRCFAMCCSTGTPFPDALSKDVFGKHYPTEWVRFTTLDDDFDKTNLQSERGWPAHVSHLKLDVEAVTGPSSRAASGSSSGTCRS